MQPRLLITGANRGIGLALVKHYLDDGWHVDASCRDISQAQELLSLASASPQNLHLHTLDVTDHDAVMALSQTLKGTPLDLLINNAGYYGPKGYGFGHTNANEWRKVFEVNTIAPLKMAEAFYPQLKLAPQGLLLYFIESWQYDGEYQRWWLHLSLIKSGLKLRRQKPIQRLITTRYSFCCASPWLGTNGNGWTQCFN